MIADQSVWKTERDLQQDVSLAVCMGNGEKKTTKCAGHKSARTSIGKLKDGAENNGLMMACGGRFDELLLLLLFCLFVFPI